MTPTLQRSIVLAACVAACGVVSSPAAAQFTATVTRPPARKAALQVPVAAEPTARDTMRPTVLSDMKAWVDSAAMALKTPASPPNPRDTTAAAGPQAPAPPPRSTRPRRSPR